VYGTLVGYLVGSAQNGKSRRVRALHPSPDLTLTLTLDPYAPRAARHHVAQVGRPSPDLRDAIVLLSSELVTWAVERSPAAGIELRLWMGEDVVRLEVWGETTTIRQPPAPADDYGSLVLDRVADRWALESDGIRACVWCEIDRHAAPLHQPA
jgi:hypothetical protein